jgi:hypothetical protein
LNAFLRFDNLNYGNLDFINKSIWDIYLFFYGLSITK